MMKTRTIKAIKWDWRKLTYCNLQIILDHSAGPGGTHSLKNQGLSKKAPNKERSTMSEKK